MQQSRHAADTARAGLTVRTLIRYFLLAAIAVVLLISSILRAEKGRVQAEVVNGDVIKVNFQPANSPLYAGFLPDYGQTFASRNGQTYGWNVDNAANARDRNASNAQDQRYDTLNHMQKIAGLIWEIALPNGRYSVRIVAGDALNWDSVYRINAESVQVINGTPTSSVRWLDNTATVTVADGRLTLSNASGAANNKINFIVITATSVTPQPTNTYTPTQTRTHTPTPTDTPIATVPTKDYVALTQTSAAETARFIPPSTATAAPATATAAATATRHPVSPTPTNTPTPTRTSTTPTTGCGTVNKALGRPATASSSENGGTAPNLAVDGTTGTRWSSQFYDPQWIRVDLGSVQPICRVQLKWEAAYGKAYRVEVSNDDATWTSIYSTPNGDGGIDNLTGLNAIARYVRIYGTTRATPYGYSLWELEVF